MHTITPDIDEPHFLLELLLDIAIHQFSCGAHTEKVIRIGRRISHARGYDADYLIMPQSLSISLSRTGARHARITAVRSILPLALDFSKNNALSALSWQAENSDVSLPRLRALFQEIIARPRLNPHLVTLLISCANASFCYLFGGDMPAMGLVLCGTACGFELRRTLNLRGVHHLLALILASLLASLIAGLAVTHNLSTTPAVALATSVLYLIPGVPLLNSLIDILDGHVLTGLAWLVNACTLIICISLGLLGTMFLLGIDKL